MITIGSLREEDRAAWEALARGYKEFYRAMVPDEGYEQTWQRLRGDAEFHGIGAWSHGELVGIAHYLFHRRSGWKTVATSRTFSSTRRHAAEAWRGC